MEGVYPHNLRVPSSNTVPIILGSIVPSMILNVVQENSIFCFAKIITHKINVIFFPVHMLCPRPVTETAHLSVSTRYTGFVASSNDVTDSEIFPPSSLSE